MSKVRVSAISFKAGKVASYGDFARHVRELVEEASRAAPDFIVLL